MSEKKLCILFAPLSIFISHVTRCLCVANQFRINGHEIHFLSCEKYYELIKSEGYKTHLVSEINFEKEVIFGAPIDYQQKYNPKLSDLSYGFKNMIRDDLRIIEKLNPDVIVYDGRGTVILSAIHYNILAVEIRNHVGNLLINEIKSLKENGVVRELDINENDYAMASDEFCKAALSFPFKFNKKGSLSKKQNPVIIPGIKEFEMPDNHNVFEERSHCFSGPLFYNNLGEGRINEHLPLFRNKIVIMVTMGSSFPFKNFYSTITNALNGNEYFVIINTGNNDFPDNYVSGNCLYIKYISLEEYLQHTDVVVFHGGHGTAMHIVKAGVVSLVIPFNADHMEISNRINDLKIGKRLKKYPDLITEEDISTSIKELIGNDIYKKNAQDLKESLTKEKCPEKKAYDFIMDCYEQMVN